MRAAILGEVCEKIRVAGWVGIMVAGWGLPVAVCCVAGGWRTLVGLGALLVWLWSLGVTLGVAVEVLSGGNGAESSSAAFDEVYESYP